MFPFKDPFAPANNNNSNINNNNMVNDPFAPQTPTRSTFTNAFGLTTAPPTSSISNPFTTPTNNNNNFNTTTPPPTNNNPFRSAFHDPFAQSTPSPGIHKRPTIQPRDPFAPQQKPAFNTPRNPIQPKDPFAPQNNNKNNNPFSSSPAPPKFPSLDPFAPHHTPPPQLSSSLPPNPFTTAPPRPAQNRPLDPFAAPTSVTATIPNKIVPGDPFAPKPPPASPPWSNDGAMMDMQSPSHQGQAPQQHHHPFLQQPHSVRPHSSSGPPAIRDPFASPQQQQNNHHHQQNRNQPQHHRKLPAPRSQLFLRAVPEQLFNRDAMANHFATSAFPPLYIQHVTFRPNRAEAAMGNVRRTAVITFTDEAEATRALQCNSFNGEQLQLSVYRTAAERVVDRAGDPSNELLFSYIPEDLFSELAIRNLFNNICPNSVTNVSTREKPTPNGVKRTAIVTFVNVESATTALKNLPSYHNAKLNVSFRQKPVPNTRAPMEAEDAPPSNNASTPPSPSQSQQQGAKPIQTSDPFAQQSANLQGNVEFDQSKTSQQKSQQHYQDDQQQSQHTASVHDGGDVAGQVYIPEPDQEYDEPEHTVYQTPPKQHQQQHPKQPRNQAQTQHHYNQHHQPQGRQQHCGPSLNQTAAQRKAEIDAKVEARHREMDELRRKIKEKEEEKKRLKEQQRAKQKEKEKSRDSKRAQKNNNSKNNNSTKNNNNNTTTKSNNNNGNKEEWRKSERVNINDAVLLVGTCQTMCPQPEIDERTLQEEFSVFESSNGMFDPDLAVKKYRRSAAISEQPVPEDVRPPEVLSRTMNHLKRICDSKADFDQIHHFVRDRTRSLRQDFTLQGVKDSTCIRIHEESVRFHILSEHRLFGLPIEKFSSKQNREQLDKCLISLREMYDLRRERKLPMSPNEPEMQAYYVLTHMSEPKKCVQLLSGFAPDVRRTKALQFAFKVVRATSRSYGNPATFFACVREAPYLTACLLHSRFTEVRANALVMMNGAHGMPQSMDYVPLLTIFERFGFETIEEAFTFCRMLGLKTTKAPNQTNNNSENNNNNNNRATNHKDTLVIFPSPIELNREKVNTMLSKWKPMRSIKRIESKSKGLKPSTIIEGKGGVTWGADANSEISPRPSSSAPVPHVFRKPSKRVLRTLELQPVSPGHYQVDLDPELLLDSPIHPRRLATDDEEDDDKEVDLRREIKIATKKENLHQITPQPQPPEVKASTPAKRSPSTLKRPRSESVLSPSFSPCATGSLAVTPGSGEQKNMNKADGTPPTAKHVQFSPEGLFEKSTDRAPAQKRARPSNVPGASDSPGWIGANVMCSPNSHGGPADNSKSAEKKQGTPKRVQFSPDVVFKPSSGLTPPGPVWTAEADPALSRKRSRVRGTSPSSAVPQTTTNYGFLPGISNSKFIGQVKSESPQFTPSSTLGSLGTATMKPSTTPSGITSPSNQSPAPFSISGTSSTSFAPLLTSSLTRLTTPLSNSQQEPQKIKTAVISSKPSEKSRSQTSGPLSREVTKSMETAAIKKPVAAEAADEISTDTAKDNAKAKVQKQILEFADEIAKCVDTVEKSVNEMRLRRGMTEALYVIEHAECLRLFERIQELSKLAKEGKERASKAKDEKETTITHSVLVPPLRKASLLWDEIEMYLTRAESQLCHVKLRPEPLPPNSDSLAGYTLLPKRKVEKPQILVDMNVSIPTNMHIGGVRQPPVLLNELTDVAIRMIQRDLRFWQVGVINMSVETELASAWAQMRLSGWFCGNETRVIKLLELEEGNSDCTDRYVSVVNAESSSDIPNTVNVVVAAMDISSVKKENMDSIENLKSALQNLKERSAHINSAIPALIVVTTCSESVKKSRGKGMETEMDMLLGGLQREGLTSMVDIVKLNEEEVLNVDMDVTFREALLRSVEVASRWEMNGGLRCEGKNVVDELVKRATFAWKSVLVNTRGRDDLNMKNLDVLREINREWLEFAKRLEVQAVRWPLEIKRRTQFKNIRQAIMDKLRLPMPKEIGANSTAEYIEYMVKKVDGIGEDGVKKEIKVDYDDEDLHPMWQFCLGLNTLCRGFIKTCVGDVCDVTIPLSTWENVQSMEERKKEMIVESRFQRMDRRSIDVLKPLTSEVGDALSREWQRQMDITYNGSMARKQGIAAQRRSSMALSRTSVLGCRRTRNWKVIEGVERHDVNGSDGGSGRALGQTQEDWGQGLKLHEQMVREQEAYGEVLSRTYAELQARAAAFHTQRQSY